MCRASLLSASKQKEFFFSTEREKGGRNGSTSFSYFFFFFYPVAAEPSSLPIYTCIRIIFSFYFFHADINIRRHEYTFQCLKTQTTTHIGHVNQETRTKNMRVYIFTLIFCSFFSHFNFNFFFFNVPPRYAQQVEAEGAQVALGNVIVRKPTCSQFESFVAFVTT